MLFAARFCCGRGFVACAFLFGLVVPKDNMRELNVCMRHAQQSGANLELLISSFPN